MQVFAAKTINKQTIVLRGLQRLDVAKVLCSAGQILKQVSEHR